MSVESNVERLTKLEGIGCARKRREDPRFIQGKGTYVDDVKMPGMCFGSMVRSPYAHARIKRIDSSRALKLPGVIAVITAEELKPFKLHWMPTLAGDVQAVLADGKVSFQNQEVAFVIAEDRYLAADGAELVEVEYEELPAVVDPFKALQPDAPVVREDLTGKSVGAHGARRHHNHIFTWEIGDRDKTERAFESAEVTVKQDMLYPRVHPCPLETCGCVASFDKIKGDLTVYITSQAPHVVRTVVGLLSSIPESKIRIISPDIGGGFGNKVGVYPGYVCAIAASIVLGRPVKWIESRSENLSSTAFARDYWMSGELAATRDGVIKALRVKVTADHGAFDACADPTKWPAGMFHVCTGSYAIPNAFVSVDGVYTNKFPGGVAYRCSFRVTEAVYLIERMIDVLAQKLGIDKAEIRFRNFIRKEQFPHHTPLGLDYDSGRLRHGAAQGAGSGRLPGPARRAGEETRGSRGRVAHGHRRRHLYGDRRRRAVKNVRYPGRGHVRFLRDPRASGRIRGGTHGHDHARPGPPDDVCPDHRQRGGNSGLGDQCGGGRHVHGALWPRHLRFALDAGGRRCGGARFAQDPRKSAAHCRSFARGQRRRSAVRPGSIDSWSRAPRSRRRP